MEGRQYRAEPGLVFALSFNLLVGRQLRPLEDPAGRWAEGGRGW